MCILPWVNIAILIKRISNANLCPIDPLNIFRNSNYYFVDLILPQEVDSPPWTQEIISLAAGPMAIDWITIPINGFVRTARPKLTGLCRNSSLGNVKF